MRTLELLSPDGPAAHRGAGPHAERTWWRHRIRAMGTVVDVVAFGGAPEVRTRCEALIRECETSWSRFRDDSHLSVLNRSPRSCVPVPELLELALSRAVIAWAETDGWFDPTVLDAVVAAGYDRDFRELDQRPRPAPERRIVPGAGDVHVSRGHVVRPVGVHLDLGGIGKGLAADLAVRELLGAGVESAAVSVGGDVRVAGRVPDGGWRIPVADAFSGGWARTVVLDAGGVATSSTQVRRWPDEAGGWIHHLVDPTTGCPSNSGVRSVTVAADEAWWAEVLAKAALVAGPERGGELIERAGAVGWCSADDGGEIRVGVPVRPGDACRWETDRGPDRSEVAPTRPDRTGSGRGAPG